MPSKSHGQLNGTLPSTDPANGKRRATSGSSSAGKAKVASAGTNAQSASAQTASDIMTNAEVQMAQVDLIEEILGPDMVDKMMNGGITFDDVMRLTRDLNSLQPDDPARMAADAIRESGCAPAAYDAVLPISKPAHAMTSATTKLRSAEPAVAAVKLDRSNAHVRSTDENKVALAVKAPLMKSPPAKARALPRNAHGDEQRAMAKSAVDRVVKSLSSQGGSLDGLKEFYLSNPDLLDELLHLDQNSHASRAAKPSSQSKANGLKPTATALPLSRDSSNLPATSKVVSNTTSTTRSDGTIMSLTTTISDEGVTITGDGVMATSEATAALATLAKELVASGAMGPAHLAPTPALFLEEARRAQLDIVDATATKKTQTSASAPAAKAKPCLVVSAPSQSLLKANGHTSNGATRRIPSPSLTSREQMNGKKSSIVTSSSLPMSKTASASPTYSALSTVQIPVTKRPPSPPKDAMATKNKPPSKPPIFRTTSGKHPPGCRCHEYRANPATMEEIDGILSKIFLERFKQDACRLYATRIERVARSKLPRLIEKLLALCGPGWIAANAYTSEIQEYYRTHILADLRELDDRIWTNSAEWVYTAVRRRVISAGFLIPYDGLAPADLPAIMPSLRAMLKQIEACPKPVCGSLPQFPPVKLDQTTLMRFAQSKAKLAKNDPAWRNWRAKLELGLARMIDSLWETVGEFDVPTFGQGVTMAFQTRNAGIKGWETTQRFESIIFEEEEERAERELATGAKRSGKRRADEGGDGRGAGVSGWDTIDEEDLWERRLEGVHQAQLPTPAKNPADVSLPAEDHMSIGERSVYRLFLAEADKDEGNKAYRRGDYAGAAGFYSAAHTAENRLPVYLLNRAMAYLKLELFEEAEEDCNSALLRHPANAKGLWRRAKARRGLSQQQGRIDKLIGAERDVLAFLKLKPDSSEGQIELLEIRAELFDWQGMGPPVRNTDNVYMSTSAAIHFEDDDKRCETQWELTESERRQIRIEPDSRYPQWLSFTVRRVLNPDEDPQSSGEPYEVTSKANSSLLTSM
ncbi:uncharacterized protein L969DRAFT_94322 [Mixia osmundae IAM 14324]|uniref:Uncharacterized protein n=1 Tax=Mixia osmundae (strain CBS 9802 / IAM 14324 / JCM 22182 / KY 12970) TaxID=764103 RepID=G7DZT4_MIXOS|nr:uncharacterized protein L969DRAFT_94322 [Mixia osmundae IAM 14324]KEI39246.1 hypothetical protein L969DRAFT_94322 [Mixia osmundae IAM 14324]GAA96094.1 hypothetical protein E5Q_02755 [Mixia osmundae IAM 14324]